MGLADGFLQGAQGMQQLQLGALQIKQQQSQLDDAKRQLAARAAMYAGMDQGGTGGAPAMAPGQPSPPAAQGGLGAMGAAGGMPQPPRPGMAPGGQPGAMAGPPQGGPAGGAPPTPAAGPGGPQPMSGMAQGTQDPVQSSIQTMHSIASDIKRRNPNIDPLTLADAVDQTINTMKGLNPGEKEFLMAQTNLVRAQYQYMANQGHDQARMYGYDKRSEDVQDQDQTRREVAQTGASSRETVAKTGAGAKVEAAGIGAGARKYAADRGVDSSNIRAGATRDAATTRAGATRDAAKTGADARRDSSAYANPAGASQMGYKPGSAPGGVDRRAGAAAPVRVRTPTEAAKLKPGTRYETPDGQVFTR